MTIIAGLPNTISNGQSLDADPLMTDLNYIVSQTNANAADITAPNTFAAVQSGQAANALSNFPIASQVQNNYFNWCGTAGGTINAISLTPPIPITSYYPGQVFIFKGNGVNTGPTTVAVSGLSPIALQNGGAACIGSEITANKFYSVLVDSSGTSAQLNFLFSTPLGALGNSVTQYTTSVTLVPGSLGKLRQFAGSTPSQILTFPSVTLLATGRGFWLENVASVPVTIQGNGGELIYYSTMGSAYSSANTLILNPGDSGFYISDGSAWQEVYGIRAANIQAGVTQIQSVLCNATSNILTSTLNPVTLQFRSTTPGTGGETSVPLTAATTLAIPTTSSLGAITATISRFALLAINNAGTIELAISNLSGALNLDETAAINTTSIGGSSNSATTIYSTTGRTGVAYRVVGFVDATWTSGTGWAYTLVQGSGGTALGATSTIGYGQTWQNVTRTVGTTYYNTSGRPIETKTVFSCGTNTGLSLTIGGILMASANNSNVSGVQHTIGGIVPPGAAYVYSNTLGAPTINGQMELR